MSAPEKKSKKKDNYLEIEFQLGDLWFAARGKTLNVERNFRMLIDLVEDGKLNLSMTEQLEETIEELGEPLEKEAELDPAPSWE
ncbi:MAG: hypothetical protein KAW94_05920 [Candidatus Thorarchaeota archaeon]|jgi:hypothetical protein|nr:hypothetical protein [Candidatus Thorarchaeota archaeon]NOR38157.1 hypothetical protein [Candidatus Thorarchaeota archaeon]